MNPGPVAQSAEARVLKTLQCGFEPRPAYGIEAVSR